MIDFKNFFSSGLAGTLLLKDNGGVSHNGPWKLIHNNTIIDRWYINDFSTVDYTLSIDLNSENKEIVKCLITSTANSAKVVEYARNSTNIPLITIEARVNNSYVDVIVSPTTPKTDGSKLLFTSQRFQTQNMS